MPAGLGLLVVLLRAACWFAPVLQIRLSSEVGLCESCLNVDSFAGCLPAGFAAPGCGIIRGRRKNTEIFSVGFVWAAFLALEILAGEVFIHACCLGCLGWPFFHTDNAMRIVAGLVRQGGSY